MAKKPKSKNVGKGKSKSNLISRPDFLKSAGLTAAGIAAAAVGLGGVGKALGASPYTPEEYKTLAALVDTYVPGVKGEPVLILPAGEMMYNLGAVGTDTPGAAFLPMYPEDGVMYSVLPCYFYLGGVLNNFGISVADVVGMLDGLTGIFNSNPGKRFYELPYEDDFENGEKVGWGRYHILYMMEKPDLLIPLLVNAGYPQEEAANMAAAATSIFRHAGFSTYTVYFSELCNIIPSGFGQEISLGPGMKLILPEEGKISYDYSRGNEESKYGWRIIPGSIWDQSGFPGPSYKNPDFASDYEGMKVKISDSKVTFIQ